MLGVVLAQSPSPSVPASPLPDIETGLPAAKVAAVEALISAAMTRLGIPGFSAAVVTERRLRWSNAFGTADLENFVPAKNVTVYRLASVTKPIAATAVLQLVEAGKVDVEGVSGKPFLEYLDERVFAPAGMEAARGDDVLAIIPNRAAGYQMGAGGELRNSPMSDTSNRTAGGGLMATAEDVARFAVALQKGTLLKASTAQAAFGRQRTRDRKITGYGLGWIVGEAAGRTEIYHTGGQPRVSTVLYMAPRSGFAVVLLCNLEGVSTPLLDLARQVADTLLR